MTRKIRNLLDTEAVAVSRWSQECPILAFIINVKIFHDV